MKPVWFADASSQMTSVVRQYVVSWGKGWNAFWFTPSSPHVLAGLRLFTGWMLLYSHLVLATDLTSFLGDTAWINNETARQLHDGGFGVADWGISYLWYLSSPAMIWVHHLLAILVTFCFMAGILTRVTAPLAWLIQLMYLHRLTGALFGFDQIVTYSTMYLMFAPCGSLLSVDAWIRKRYADAISSKGWFDWLFPVAGPSVAANIATRLLQIHLCAIYFYGGLAKARGSSWWDGTAIWYSIANLEYQSIDMTWLAKYPKFSSLLAHTTMFWEISYIALVWPRITRPLVIAIAIATHGGIALFLGMITFGSMMIAANMIFLPPSWFDRSERKSGKVGSSRGDRFPADSPREADETFEPDDLELDVDDDSIDSMSELDDLSLVDFDGNDVSLDELNDSVINACEASVADSGGSPSGNDEIQSLKRRLQRVIRKREDRIREASEKINRRAKKLKSREEIYRQRVEKLKSREAKIKSLIDRAKDRKGR